jgi:dihydrolipoamide dehydrogenase
MLPHLLPLEDEEAAGVLAKEFQARGIRILAGTRVESVQTGEKGVTVHVSGEGGEQTLEAEQALIAIGFRPNSEDLGLEELGVAKDARGFITIDDRMATNVPGIWAIGDVTGRLLLAHVASAQGIVCAENIAGVETVTLDYRMMPRAVYSQPQVASFGLSESEAKEQGYEVTVGRFPYQANGKALGLGESAGFVKLVTDNRYGEVLGATLVGPDVSELLPELTLAHNAELTVDDIARNVHAHPTLSEALMEAAENAEGRAIDI